MAGFPASSEGKEENVKGNGKFMRKKLLAVLMMAGLSWSAAAQGKKVLVVTTTTGFRHSSIPTAEKVLGQLAKQSGAFTVDYVSQPPNEPKRPQKPKDGADAAAQEKFKAEEAQYNAARKAWGEEMKKVLTKLSPQSLKQYDGVIFANTTGDLPLPDPQGFLDWIKEGHGFVGMHSASDTFHGFRPYIEMLGGEFQSHGAQVSVDADNEDQQCAACRHLGGKWTVYDEIYIIKSFDRTKVHSLLSLDAEPNKKTPGYYPISWIKEYGKGRVFYTSLGHREDVWDKEFPNRKNDPKVAEDYQKHILGGIKWVLGLETCNPKPQAK